MIRIACLAGAAVGALSAALTPVYGQALSAADQHSATQPGAGLEIWSSTDSDKTGVVKLLGRALWDYQGADKFQGIDLERAWFTPLGQQARRQSRVYLDFADSLNGKWRWNAKLGTNGNTMLGSASIRALDWSKELFIEREIVETPRGLDEGLYYTFAGASMDFPAGELDTFNSMVGIQKFTGRNERLHLRGTYVHVIKRQLGLSIQLRARYFHSTSPGEYDYYSPRDFIQLVPVLQLRRFDSAGWMYLLAFGYGVQKATTNDWQGARIADVRLESPGSSRKLRAFLQLQYSNSSLTRAASGYHYVAARVGLTSRL